MLRLNPTRIDLALSDIKDFDTRSAQRRQAGLSTSAPSNNLRLSIGPGRQTRHAIVHRPERSSHARSDSHSSQTASIESGVPELEVSSDDHRFHTDHTALQSSWTVPTIHEDTSQSIIDGSQAIAPHDAGVFHPGMGIVRPRQANIALSAGADRPHDAAMPQPLRSSSDLTMTRGGRLPLQEDRFIQTDISPRHGLARSPIRTTGRQEPPPQLYIDNPNFQRHVEFYHCVHPAIPTSQAAEGLQLHFAREFVTDQSDRATDHALMLDPGAPSFVPRTRFAAADGTSFAGTDSASIAASSSHIQRFSSLSVRTQAISQQNTHLPARARTLESSSTHHLQQFPFQMSHIEEPRPLSSTHSIHPEAQSHPRLSQPAAQRRGGSNSHFEPAILGLRISEDLLDSAYEGSGTTERCQIPHRRPAPASLPIVTSGTGLNTVGEEMIHVASSYNQSTPVVNNLSHTLSPSVRNRSSSLHWAQNVAPSLNFDSLEQLNSEDCEDHDLPFSRPLVREQASTQLGALNMRQSPLDDLTERLSRLCSGRPRSVGRSWELSSEARLRPSLLAGDLFRQSPSHNFASNSNNDDCMDASDNELTTVGCLIASPGEPDPVFLLEQPSRNVLRLFPGSTGSATSHSTPTTQTSLKDQSSTPFRTAIKRRPLASGGPAAKVSVYNDVRSFSTPSQPGQEAEKPPRLVHMTLGSTPAVDEIRRKDQHDHSEISTRPAHLSFAGSPVEAIKTTTSSSAVPITPYCESFRMEQAARYRRSLEQRQVENEFEGHVDVLEADRRLWNSRQEPDGSLDKTPPKRGRFEHYMS